MDWRAASLETSSSHGVARVRRATLHDPLGFDRAGARRFDPFAQARLSPAPPTGQHQAASNPWPPPGHLPATHHRWPPIDSTWPLSGHPTSMAPNSNPQTAASASATASPRHPDPSTPPGRFPATHHRWPPIDSTRPLFGHPTSMAAPTPDSVTHPAPDLRLRNPRSTSRAPRHRHTAHPPILPPRR